MGFNGLDKLPVFDARGVQNFRPDALKRGFKLRRKRAHARDQVLEALEVGVASLGQVVDVFSADLRVDGQAVD